MSDHHRYMQSALSLARRNLGQTWPNPAVGAVVVNNGRIVGQGWTARGGRPHAETQALEQAGPLARGACLYVTLEPCAHHGKTPPCTEAIIKAGIDACVVACRDPHPQVSGKGIAQLKAAGIDVTEGVEEKEALEINRGFFSVIEKKRPYVALKIATSLDGKIAYPSSPSPGRGEGRGEGESNAAVSALTPSLTLPPTGGGDRRWITGEQARAYGHLLRSRFDAIATGMGTVLTDDPLLTCRLPGLENCSPVRVVFDRQNRLPQDSQLLQTASDAPVWPTALPLPEAMHWLAEQGITRLLVEGGRDLTNAFLQSGLVDRVYWFRAPFTIGGESTPGVDITGALPSLIREDMLALGDDTLGIYSVWR